MRKKTLTEIDEKIIRDIYKNHKGIVTTEYLANLYNVSFSTIRRIIDKKESNDKELMTG